MIYSPIKSRASIVALFIANLVPIFGIYLWGWELFTIIFLFWLESAVVGFYNIVRMIRISPIGSIPFVPLFIIHYGGFMSVHLVFIFALFNTDIEYKTLFPPLTTFVKSVYAVLPALIALFASHGYSYFVNFIGKKEYENTDLSKQMHAPYRRIILLHISIIFGGFLILSLGETIYGILFLILLKLIFDILAHIKEHKQSFTSPSI